jgi:predicted amidohydrolase
MRKVVTISTVIVIVLVLFLLAGPMLNKPPESDLIPPRLMEWIGRARPLDVSKMHHKMRVAVVSAQGFEQKEKNVQELVNISTEIVKDHRDVRLIVFGESSLGLYYRSNEPSKYQDSVAERVPGNVTGEIGRLAMNLNVYIAFGLIEKTHEGLFNSLAVVSPEGKVVALHRKMLLHYPDEQNGIRKAPPNAEVVTIDGFRAGLAICADGNSKWLTKSYLDDQIDVLLYSVTSKVPLTVFWLKYYPPAKRFHAWVLAANRYGHEEKEDYPGTIFVADRGGAVHSIRSDGPGYVTAVIAKD